MVMEELLIGHINFQCTLVSSMVLPSASCNSAYLSLISFQNNGVISYIKEIFCIDSHGKGSIFFNSLDFVC
jgi:hypothetical protein